MANVDNAFGLRPVSKLGGVNSGILKKYFVPASDATALFIGDPVVRAAGGSNPSQVGIYPAGTLPIVTRATAGATNSITGIVVAVEYPESENTDPVYRTASTDAIVFVVDDPDTVFEVQANGAVTATMVGLNAVLAAGTGSTGTGKSGFELDITGTAPAADATYQVRIDRVQNAPSNELGTNAVLEVKLNLHTESNNAVVGI